MASNETVLVEELGVPGGKRIRTADFDPSVHTKHGKTGPAKDHDDARGARAKELKGLSADEVKEIAIAAGIAPSTKAENIDAIMAAEFPE